MDEAPLFRPAPACRTGERSRICEVPSVKCYIFAMVSFATVSLMPLRAWKLSSWSTLQVFADEWWRGGNRTEASLVQSGGIPDAFSSLSSDGYWQHGPALRICAASLSFHHA